MNVSELISMVGIYSFGRDNPTDKEKEIYLRYLNQANEKLYNIAVNSERLKMSSDVYTDEETIDNVTYNYINIPSYYIKAVITNKKLNVVSYEEVETTDENEFYYHLNNKIYFNSYLKSRTVNGEISKYVTLIHTVPYKKLVVEIDDNDIETNIPIYPSHLHHVLVECAVYKLYLSKLGYVQHLAHMEKLYKEGLTDLNLYYSLDK